MREKGFNVIEENVEQWKKEGWLRRFYNKPCKTAVAFQMRVLFDHLARKDKIKKGKLTIIERSAYTCIEIFGNLLFEDDVITKADMDLFDLYFKRDWPEIKYGQQECRRSRGGRGFGYPGSPEAGIRQMSSLLDSGHKRRGFDRMCPQVLQTLSVDPFGAIVFFCVPLVSDNVFDRENHPRQKGVPRNQTVYVP